MSQFGFEKQFCPLFQSILKQMEHLMEQSTKHLICLFFLFRLFRGFFKVILKLAHRCNESYCNFTASYKYKARLKKKSAISLVQE